MSSRICVCREPEEVSVALKFAKVHLRHLLERDVFASFGLASVGLFGISPEEQPHSRRLLNFISDQHEALGVHVSGCQRQRGWLCEVGPEPFKESVDLAGDGLACTRDIRSKDWRERPVCGLRHCSP